MVAFFLCLEKEIKSDSDKICPSKGIVSYSNEFGKGFTITNLKYMRQFYLAFSKGHTLCDQLTISVWA